MVTDGVDVLDRELMDNDTIRKVKRNDHGIVIERIYVAPTTREVKFYSMVEKMYVYNHMMNTKLDFKDGCRITYRQEDYACTILVSNTSIEPMSKGIIERSSDAKSI